MTIAKVFSIALVLASLTLLPADTLELKDGTQVQGSFVGGTTREIRILGVDGTLRSYALTSVSAIEFGAPPEPAPAPVPAAPAPQMSVPPAVSVIPAGTAITVRMIDGIDTKATAIGERFRASIDDPVVIGNQVAIMRGADATLQVMEVEDSKELAVKLYDITLNGRSYDAVSSYAHLEASGPSKAKKGFRRGVALGGIGAGIGAIAGGGKGAAIGAVAGAGLGALSGAAAKGKHLVIPPETRLTFELRAPLPLN